MTCQNKKHDAIIKPKWVRELANNFADNIDMTKVESNMDTFENIDPINTSIDTI